MRPIMAQCFPMITVGDVLRILRKHRNFTQESLAAQLGVDKNTISRAEDNRANPAV